MAENKMSAIQAQIMVHDAYDLLVEFAKTVEAMEGDHPSKPELEKWLNKYEEFVK